MASATGDHGLSRGRRTGRLDGRTRSSISSREELSAGPPLGWSRAPGTMGVHLPRRRRHRILARRRLALADLRRRTNLSTRGEGRLLLDSRRPQGIRKSTALRTIAGEYFTDELADLGSKDAVMQTRGVWIIELSELDSLSHAEVARIKAFMSRTTDRFRPPMECAWLNHPASASLLVP